MEKITIEEAIYTLNNAAFLGTEEALKKDEDAVKMAMDALKRQIPKKPKLKGFGTYCAVCGGYMVKQLFHDYCCRCGQRIDWTEEEK